jgi:ubiquinone/menaquinone biosynthesis C-methylase UbiE
LFAFASPDENLKTLSPDYKILDVLGGDGLLTRTLSTLEASFCMPAILTSDISQYMISAAQAHGLPSLQQPAQYLLLKEASFHAVIIAYGSHHIPVRQRLQVCQEASRVLKPGGHLVLHDFEQPSPVASWFQHVVHPYSLTGHDFPHFTSQQMYECLHFAGFRNVRVQYMYDPFVFQSDTKQQVIHDLANYLFHMYGLTKLMAIHNERMLQEAVYDLALQYFRYDYQSMGLPSSFGVPHIHIEQRGNRWYLEMPRVALVGRARKE